MIYPDSKQKYTTVAVAVTVPLTTIFVFLRVYTKLRITRNVGWDDCTYTCSDLGFYDVGS